MGIEGEFPFKDTDLQRIYLPGRIACRPLIPLAEAALFKDGRRNPQNFPMDFA
jgi:hypothetical protein